MDEALLSIIISTAVLFLGIAGFYLTSSARFLTIREHNEFKHSVLSRLDKIDQAVEKRVTTEDVHRELDQLRSVIARMDLRIETRLNNGFTNGKH